MPSAGELLRSERQKRNRSLAEISERTCISKRYLEAIEADEVSALPGEFFYKAFIRQYARALELDESATERIVAAAVPVHDPDPVPVLKEAIERTHRGNPTRWSPSTGVALGVLLLVLAGGSGLYALWQRYQAQRDAAPQTTEAPALAETPPAVEQTPMAQPAETAPQPEPTAPAPTPAEVPPPGQASLQLAASEPVWVQLNSEGRTVFVGTIQPSETREFTVAQDARLLTGNAGGLEVRWNGEAVGSLGPRGQVRTVQFSPQGPQVLPPKPRIPSPIEE